MLHFVLLPFIPTIKKVVIDYILPSLKGEEISEKILRDLYKKIPNSISSLVDEKTFVDFCMKHKETLFGKQTPVKAKPAKKKVVAKKVSVKAPAKKAVKKVAVKKAALKKKTAK